MSSTDPRPVLVSEIPLALVSALTAWLALFAWNGFVQSASLVLVPALFGIILVAGVGVLARVVRFPGPVVVTAQVLTLMLFANLSWGSSILPTPASVETTVAAFQSSVEVLGRYVAPVPSSVTEAAPVLVLGGMTCHLIVDLCAVTFRRVPLAGLPLLVVYTLPVGILGSGVNPIVFAFTVVGFLMMLALQEGHRIARWGRQFGAPEGADAPGAFGATDARRHPAAIGAAAVVLAVALPLFMPVLDLELFDGGSGAGEGVDREVRITNPMTDLRRDLVRGEDVPLVNVTTKADEAPSYLRTTVLTTFTGDAWTPGDRDLPSTNDVTADMPNPLPLDLPSRIERWDLEVTDDLDSLWLPTPLYVAGIIGAEDWRFDSSVLDVHAATNEMSTRGMDYSVDRIEPDIAAERLADADPAPPDISAQYLGLPSNFPDRVEELTSEVIRGAETDYDKAAALQRWFREDGGFRYTTQRAAGNGNDALVEFLEEGGRAGYCEQFASAMAVMARSAGIPARVAVGFFRSEQVAPNRYVFSSHDLHAWPELYFEDTGWVRFEPTPASHIPGVPGYSDDAAGADPLPAESPGASQPASPTPTQSARPEPAAPPEQADATDGGGGEDGLPWLPLLATLGVLLLLLALALTPRVLRRRRTARRWHQPAVSVEVAWAELADSAADLGIRWPTGLSPRATGSALARLFAAPQSPETPQRPETGPETNPDALAAMVSLVHALEQERYAATTPATDRASLRGEVETCVEAWRGGVTPRDRFRADWWPRSVLSRRTPRAGAPEPSEPDRGLVDHIG